MYFSVSLTICCRGLKMLSTVFWAILIPFLGTVAGSAFCFFIKKKSLGSLENIMSGFAGGVMLAASIWSLILPSFELFKHQSFAIFRVFLGVLIGIFFIVICDKLISYIRKNTKKFFINERFSFIFAVVLHNIPEGVAIGVAVSAAIYCSSGAEMLSALILACSIALQNIPEGAIISMPLVSYGKTKKSAFIIGSLSGIVEPIAAFAALFFSRSANFLLPYLLSFAAGAMIYVTATELIPSAIRCNSNYKINLRGTLSFFIGFLIMMLLDLLS